MPHPEPLFGLTFCNVPIFNLRQEFTYYRNLFADPEFRSHLLQQHGSVYSEYAAYATKQSFLTNVIQRCVSGLEAYIRFAAIHQAGWERRLSKEFFQKTKNPFTLGARSIVANYYDRLPALVQPAYSLRIANPELYKLATRFYSEVRNPLFHGNEVHNDDEGQATSRVLNFIAQLYDWIDSWCPLENGKHPPWQEPAHPTTPQGRTVTLRLRAAKLGKPK